MQLLRIEGHLDQFRKGPGNLLHEPTRVELDGALVELEASLQQLDDRLEEAAASPDIVRLLSEFLKDSELRLPTWPHSYAAFILRCGNEAASNLTPERPTPHRSPDPGAC
jgi:hypothetical protein